MDQQIKALETEARKLEPSFEHRIQMTAKAVRYAQSFLQDLPDKKAFVVSEKKRGKLLDSPISDSPIPLNELLGLLEQEVDTPGLNPASGNHLGYIPGGGIYPSALGDYLAAVSNRYAGVFFSSPGAVRIENICIRWMCDLIGYPDTSGGNLTSGGSIANLIGLVSARDDAEISSRDYSKCAIYTTRQIHHCVIKAIKFAGLQDARLRTIDMDHRYRIQPEVLEKQIKRDKQEGLIPLIVFASAGTTDLGAVDPLEKVGAVARKHDLWYHVDAAYGGFFMLTGQGKKILAGIEQADSVTIDPHKGLFLPYGSGALLVKDVQKLFDSQHMTASYLQDTHQAVDELSPADLSPELSRHFRGLRMWLPLKLLGVKPFQAALEEKLLLARYFYEKIQSIENIEVGPEPQLSVLFFRYVPESRDADQFNRQLVELIHQDGRVFLSSTNINGRFYIRLAVLNFRTHLETIDLTLEIIQEKIRELTDR